MPNKLMKPSNADSGLPLMRVVVIVANVEKEVPVIKHADPGQLAVCGHAQHLTARTGVLCVLQHAKAQCLRLQ